VVVLAEVKSHPLQKRQRMGHPGCGGGRSGSSDILFTHPLRLRSVRFGHAMPQDAKDGAPRIMFVLDRSDNF
jgi:hypothetical protein